MKAGHANILAELRIATSDEEHRWQAERQQHQEEGHRSIPGSGQARGPDQSDPEVVMNSRQHSHHERNEQRKASHQGPF